jgi:hypothetical protein
MQYKPKHCWDCGTQVIGGAQGGHMAMPNLRQVKFGLPDGSYHESPFCEGCANRVWTMDRILAFEQAVKAIVPQYPGVTSVQGVRVLREPIAAILSLDGEPT